MVKYYLIITTAYCTVHVVLSKLRSQILSTPGPGEVGGGGGGVVVGRGYSCMKGTLMLVREFE